MEREDLLKLCVKQEKYCSSNSCSPKPIENAFLTLNESRPITDDTKTSAFSPFQKPSLNLEPFNSEQEFLEEAQRCFSSFFTNPGHPEDSLLSVLPPIRDCNITSLQQPAIPNFPIKQELGDLRREYSLPLRGPPSQSESEFECYCICCIQWKLYFNPPSNELNARPVPKLCYCVCCRRWHMYHHFTYNTQRLGYYDGSMFMNDVEEAKPTGSKKKRKKSGPRKPRVKTEIKDKNKENTGKRKKKQPARFSNKNLMKKDHTLKLNTTFQPQIPYLTPLDS